MSKPQRESLESLLERLTGVNPHVCPICNKGRMVPGLELRPVGKGTRITVEDL